MIDSVVADTAMLVETMGETGGVSPLFYTVAIMLFGYVLFLFGFVLYRLLVPPKTKNGD